MPSIDTPAPARQASDIRVRELNAFFVAEAKGIISTGQTPASAIRKVREKARQADVVIR